MAALAPIATTVLVVVLIAFALLILLKMLNGDIATSGLLSTRRDGAIDPERLLMLTATVMAAFAYLSYGLKKGLSDGVMPDIPDDLVTALGGGNLLYLSGKIFRTGRLGT